MKKFMFVLVALVAITLVAAGSAMALVADSKHNLSTTGSTTAYRGTTSETCVFCHTPHGAIVANVLWNRTNPGTASFTAYGTTRAGTTAAVGTLNGGSLNCLSCHDGVTALGGAIINQPNSGSTGLLTTLIAAGAVTNIGQTLTNDHPIGIVYTTALAGLKAPNGIATDGVIRLTSGGVSGVVSGVTGNTVQCVSCHNPHLNTSTAFLRVLNTNSDMCIGCHSSR